MVITNEQIKGGAGSGNFGHGGRLGERGGSGSGERSENTGSFDEKGLFHADEKKYQGKMIDVGLDEHQMDRLNSVLGIDVISTCSGHPELSEGGLSAIGGTKYPGFNFTLYGSGSFAEAKAEELAKGLRDKDTSVTTKYWRGPYGNWVTHENGKPRLDIFSEKDIDAYPTDRVTISVKSNLPNNGRNQEELKKWWSNSITRLEKSSLVNKKSLKAADNTLKERWEQFLNRAEDEGFLTGDEIDELRDRYDEGDISDDDIPLPLDEAIDEIDQDDVEENRKKLLPLLPLTFSKRAKERDKLQTNFEDKVIRAASEKDSIPEWQQEFKEEIANNILDQRLLGLGTEKDIDTGSAPFLGEVNDAIQFQQARLSRFADERAVRTLTDREWSDAYIAARSAMYSGQGRAEFFKGAETDLPDGSIIYYKAIGDANTCSPCQEADENSPYLPDDENLPYPGEVCDGHGYCRCEHEIIHDPALAQILSGSKSFVKGGAGSGNFGHQGRPGERGGSSSEGPENGIEPHTVQDIYGRDRVVTDWPKEWGIEPGTYTAYRAGGLESPRGIFLAPDRKSAEAYDSNKQGVNTYEVTIKNPIVFENYIDGMVAATGKTREQILDSRNRAKVVNEWTRAADKKIADYAKRKRYDAVVYTKPPAPAMREINFVGNKDSIKLKDAKSFFQVKGGPGSGRHKEFNTIDRNAQRLREKVPEQELSDKALKAKLAYSPAEKAVQDHAEANEVRLAKGIGGRSLPDNEPMDVHRVVGNNLHGVEVKTMVTNTRDKVEMKRSAVERKVDWAKQHGAILHTVVIDDRRSFGNGKNAHLYSGNRLYYKRGVGAYRIGNMHPVSSHSELKRLMDMKDEELPQKARGLIR